MRSYRFTHAVTRRPSRSIVDGLRAVDSGTPDIALFQEHHSAYIAALRETGAQVTELAPLEAFADSVFVEDTALCLPEGTILLRPAAPSRRDEPAHMAEPLAALVPELQSLGPADGTIEGGDILVTETEILVGVSERSTPRGIASLRRLVERWGYPLRALETPPGVLHFKTDCALLDEETILATRRLAQAGGLERYRVLIVPEGEEAAANVIRFNDLVIGPDGYPRTADMLDAAGYDLRLIGNSEAAKVDGGMSCLSLRFSPQS